MVELDWRKWPSFSRTEMKCRCGCGKADMDEGFMDWLQTVRNMYGAPMIISSGYRCPEYNNRISSTGFTGPHTTGKAIDAAVSGRLAHRLVKVATDQGATGIGIKQKGPHEKRFIHLDTLDGDLRPWIWTY